MTTQQTTAQPANKPQPPKSHAMRLPAEVRFASNGDGAKTAKVTIVARSADPVDHWYWGPIAHDFAGMTNKPRIPIDYEHGESIGYLNKFEIIDGDLVCSGALVIVPDDTTYPDMSALVQKMDEGIPYEASIEFGDDASLELVPDGMTTIVNGNEIAGPVTVVRQWTLKAVAICKFGVDSNTSVELQFSNKHTAAKTVFARITTTKGSTMKEVSPAVETPADAGAKAVNQLSEKPATEGVKPVDAAGTGKVEVQPVTAVAPATQLTQAAPIAEPEKKSDPRDEYRKFAESFGAEKGGEYFAAGKSFTDAQTEYLKFVQQQNADLHKRIAGQVVDRGASTAVKFQDAESKPVNPKTAKMSNNIGDNLAKVAGSMKLPGRN